MGIKKNRFKNLPPGFEDSFTCSMCSDFVEDPRQCPEEHLFCKLCIEKRIKEKGSCPQCPKDEPLVESQLRPLSRPVRLMMDTLEVICENVNEGCLETVKLSQLAVHVTDCGFASHVIKAKDDEQAMVKRKLDKSVEESTKRIKVTEQETNAINQVQELESKLHLALQEVDTLNALLDKDSKSAAVDILRARNKYLNETLAKVRKDLGINIESLSNSLKQKDEEIAQLKAMSFIAKQSLALNVSTTMSSKSSSSTQTVILDSIDTFNKSSLEWSKTIDKLRAKLDVDNLLFDILKAVDFDKFYQGEKEYKVSNFGEAVRAIKNAMQVIEHGDKVLNLIKCPFIAVCLAERLRCTFVISPQLKSNIIKNGFGDLFKTRRLISGGQIKSVYYRFETDGSKENGPYDVIINEWYFMGHSIQMQLAPNGRSFDVLDVDFDKNGRDPLVRLEPSFDVIHELFKDKLITQQMFSAANHLEFEKFYPKGDLDVRKKVYQILATAVRHIKVGHRVLVLLKCPFVALCLRTFYKSDCTFVVLKTVKEELTTYGLKFVSYNELYLNADKESIDLVLSDRLHLEAEVRFTFLKIFGHAFNCVTGDCTYYRRH